MSHPFRTLSARRIGGLAGCLMLAACASPMTNQANDHYAKQTARAVSLATAQSASQVDIANRGSAAQVKGIWLGSKSVPLKGDPVLPAAFRQQYHFKFPDRKFTISQAAEMISQLSGIPIRVAPDALQASAKSPVGAGGPTPSASMVAAATSDTISLNVVSSVAGVLDLATSNLGLSWEYRDGVVVISKLVTRTFPFKGPLGTMNFNFAAGRSGGSSAANATSTGTSSSGTMSTGFTSSASVAVTGTASPIKSIEDAVKAVLTPVGKVVASPSTGSVLVVDALEGVERAAKVIERENEIYSRTATFKVEVLSFTANESDEAGINWLGAFNNLAKLGGVFSSPTTLTSSNGGTLNLQILSSSGAPGRFDGSQILAAALAERGKVSVVYSMDVPTRNLNVTPVSRTIQKVYLAKTTPASASTAGTAGGVPGLEPGVVTTGFTATLQPSIMDTNQIALKLIIGLVDMLDMETISSGTGASQQSIQAPTTGGFEFPMDVLIKPYETIVLSGYERMATKYARRGLTQDIPLLAGGSYNANAANDKLFILITPTLVGTSY